MRNTLFSLVILLAMFAFASCEDDFRYGYDEVPDGMGVVSATLTFEDFTPALESRAGGKEISKINSLWMVVYNAAGQYIDHFEVTNYTPDVTEPRPGHEDSPTACVKFSHTMPNGRYRMYAVANYDMSELDSDDLASDTRLMNLYARWNNGADSVACNSQMFGHFTESKDKDTGSLEGKKMFTAQTVVVNGNTSLHAWVRRLASKVTVAFDTRNLKDNVFIYIKSVRLRDLPQYCYLGRKNTPADDKTCTAADPQRYTNAEVDGFNSLVDKGEAIYFGGAKEDEDIRQATQTEAYKHWHKLTNADMISGVWSDRNASQVVMPGDIVTDEEIKSRIDREHGQDVEALYFYENSQPDGKAGTMTDKRQDVNGENAQVSFPNGVLENNDAWKDARKYGTYVEVEGYYVSNDSVRPGTGAIKYRFMLGKDTKINYDAERNHHYKLTLVFNGYANDVDFHIDFYNEGQPGSKTPPTVYVSYLYNQRHSLVAEATPRKGYKLSWVKAVVLDNEWRRANGDGDYNAAAWTQQVNQSDYYGSTSVKYDISDLPGYYDIKDDKIRNRLLIKKSANDKDHDVARNTEFGFLSLRNVNKVFYNLGGQKEDEGVSQDAKTRVEGMIGNFRTLWFDPENFSVTAGGETHTSDVKGPRGFVTYDKIPQETTPAQGVSHTFEDGTTYTVHMTKSQPTPNLAHDNIEFDKTYTLTLPLYTRAKTLDTYATYSGANPFYGHHRYARVRYIFHYEKEDDPNTWYEETSDTEVLQERRVDNPRGLFRTHDSKQSFHVQLAYINQVKQDDKVGYVPSTWELIESNGPWTATIQVDPHGIVKLTKGNQSAVGEGGSVKGKTGSYIDFTITPNKQFTNEVAYGAVIEVKYHNNNCIHKIIVRQGMADVRLRNGGYRWATRNLYSNGVFARSPLSMGTFYKRRGNFTRGIRESNNSKYGVGVALPGSNTLAVFDRVYDSDVNGVSWANISTTVGIEATAWSTTTIGGVTYKVPDENIYNDDIINNNDINFAFGTVYDVNATATLLNENSFNFSEPNNAEVTPAGGVKTSARGVRGVFAYSLTTGNNLFFPLGATGHGRRLSNGMLHYGTVTSGVLKGGVNNYRPMVYDLVWNLGGTYGYSKGNKNATKGYTFLGMDINYSCYRVGNLDANSVYNNQNGSNEGHSNAMLLKLVTNTK